MKFRTYPELWSVSTTIQARVKNSRTFKDLYEAQLFSWITFQKPSVKSHQVLYLLYYNIETRMRL